MPYFRLIARLDVKGDNLIKGIHLEGLRKLGSPSQFALDYYHQGIDEIIYLDNVSSLYQRNSMADVIYQTTRNVFVPITAGGGIRSLDDARTMMRCGVDKVAINTAAIKRPELLSELANTLGSQSVVLSVEAKRQNNGKWEAYTDNGRERTGLDVLDWVDKATTIGAGEILLTSVDQEGTMKGFDYELAKQVADRVSVPIILSGGMGKIEDISTLANYANVEAVAIASMLHYKKVSVQEIVADQSLANINLRSGR